MNNDHAAWDRMTRGYKYCGAGRCRRTLYGWATLAFRDGIRWLTKRVVLVGCAFCLVLGIGRFW